MGDSNLTSAQENENQRTQHHGSHSGFRRGLSDYNDGANITHYLGNDETPKNFKDQQDAFEAGKDPEFDGHIAYGNEGSIIEEDIDLSNFDDRSDYGKRHSGL